MTPIEQITLLLKDFRENINHVAKNKSKYVPEDHNACIVVVDYRDGVTPSDVYYATSSNSAFTKNQQAALEVEGVVPEPNWISDTGVMHRNHTEPKLFYSLMFDNTSMVAAAAVVTLATERDCCKSCMENTMVQVSSVFKKLRPDIKVRLVEYEAQNHQGFAQWKTPTVSLLNRGA